MKSHSIFIGDKVERAIEIIGQESDELDEYQLLNSHADGNLQVDVELRGNYLYVRVQE